MSDSNVVHSTPALGMSYRGYKPKSLSAQLVEFAAKRALSKAIDAAARRAERGHYQRSHSKSQRQFKENIMFNRTSTQTSTSSRRRNQRDEQEPVKVWVNTVLIENGGAPSRIGSGRPLQTYKTDAPVNTKDEDFNEANSVSNNIVAGFMHKAEELKDGETCIIAPNYVGNEDTFTGFAYEIRRTEDNQEANTAAKIDREAKTGDRLSGLFGG